MESSSYALIFEASNRLIEDILLVLQFIYKFISNIYNVCSKFGCFIADVISILSYTLESFTFSFDCLFKFLHFVFFKFPLSAAEACFEFVSNNPFFALCFACADYLKFILVPIANLVYFINDLSILIVDELLRLYLYVIAVYQGGNLGLSLCLLIACLIFAGSVIEFALVSCRSFNLKFRHCRGRTLPDCSSNVDAGGGLDQGEGDGWEQQRMCCVCLVEQRCIVVLPCTHFCLCSHCSAVLSNSHPTGVAKCPICRALIREFMPIISS